MRLCAILPLLFGIVVADSEDLFTLCRMFNTEEYCHNIINSGASSAASSSAASSSGSASSAASSSSSSSSSSTSAASAASAASSFGSSAAASAAAAVTDGFPQFGSFNPLTGGMMGPGSFTGGMMGPGFPGGSMGSPSISSSTSSNNGAVARTVASVFPDGSASAAASAFADGAPRLPFSNDPCNGVPPPFRGQCYRRFAGPPRRPPVPPPHVFPRRRFPPPKSYNPFVHFGH